MHFLVYRCACSVPGGGPTSAGSDTITKFLTATRPTYVTNYQVTQHGNVHNIAVGTIRVNVGPTACCENFR